MNFEQIPRLKFSFSREYITLLLFLIISYSNSFSQIWEKTSGPVNGVVWAIGIDDEDVIYAADDAVLYRSTDFHVWLD